MTLMALSLAIVGVLVVVLGILRLRHLSLQALVFGLIGAIIGLLGGALASVPLSKLPEPLGGILPITVSVAFTVVVTWLVAGQRHMIVRLFPALDWHLDDNDQPVPSRSATAAGRVLVDTSVIIDGRIADIAAAGFTPGILVVPRFVLAELQNIADSDDAMRRSRGRRGLEVLNRLRETPDVVVEVSDEDVAAIREVDAKLVALAQRFDCNVLTTDYNLNRVAQIQGVRVLNVNELSNAIRPVVLPGEELMVRVVQPGKERNQGVGYLADGTMIVVESGDKLIGQEVATEVTRVFQTVAGKMIFATPRKGAVSVTEEQPPTEEPIAVPEPEPAQATETKPNRSGRNRGRGRQSHGSPQQSADDRPARPSHRPNTIGQSRPRLEDRSDNSSGVDQSS